MGGFFCQELIIGLQDLRTVQINYGMRLRKYVISGFDSL